MVSAQQHKGAIIIKNNLIYCPGTRGTVGMVTGSAQTTLAGNAAGTDPLFQDPGNEDFRIKSNSPVRGKGVSVPLLDDFLGMRRRRVSAFDVGAHRHE